LNVLIAQATDIELFRKIQNFDGLEGFLSLFAVLARFFA
jgi:hypothetical protein